MKLSRRTFLAGLTAAAASVAIPKGEAFAGAGDETYATLIDLTLCDGCKNKGTQACVDACRTVNKDKFPEPDEKLFKNYWPQPYYEDYSDMRDVKDRLTPYNWTFVQTVNVEHEGKVHELNIQRRCMHCDNPPCAKLCPFGVNKKDVDGPVHIDTDLCFGGAKCRTVCPWSVPQRQAGVGIYKYVDPMPVGGGVMFKCDLCREKLAEGKIPGCVEACPQNALKIGARKDIVKEALRLEKEKGGYLYGLKEHGGTSTIYFSLVPFDKIDDAIVKSFDKKPLKKLKVYKALNTPMRMNDPVNKIEQTSGYAKAALIAPIAGAVGAFALAAKKGGDDE